MLKGIYILELRKESIKGISVEKLFLILIIIFGTITMIVQPFFSVPDEGTHFKHAFAIFHDDSNDSNFDDYAFPEDFSSYREGEYINKYIIKKKDFRSHPLAFNLNIRNIQYLPQAIGLTIGTFVYPSSGIVLLFGRIFNFIFYVIGMYFAIRFAKIGQLFMAMVALLPLCIQQAVSVSYDVFFFVAVFLCFSLVTNLITRKKRLDIKALCLIICSSLLLFLGKQSALAFGLFFVVLPTSVYGNNKVSILLDKFWKVCKKFKWLVAIVLISLPIIYLKFKFSNYGGLSKAFQLFFNTFARSDVYSSLDDLLTTGIIGNFGWLRYRFPVWLIIIDFIFLFILAFNGKRMIEYSRIAVASLIIFLSNIFFTSLVMYFQWTLNSLKAYDSSVILGLQGRYFTPFLVCFIPIGDYFKKSIKIEIPEKKLRRWFVCLITFNFVYFILLTLLFYYSKDGGVNFITNFSGRIRSIF